MRILLAVTGMLSIVIYSVFGAFLMNDWAVVAASGVPLETTIADMKAANQPHSTIPGFTFAILGTLLAFAWGLATMFFRTALPNVVAVLPWAGILALGAPAYFFASFGNMNSVGDTYAEWNSGAAFAREAPLYISSGIAFLVAVACSAAAWIKTAARS